MYHDCRSILATSYDAEAQLYQKYPQAKHHINQLRAIGSNSPPSTGLKRKRDDSLDCKDNAQESTGNTEKQEKSNHDSNEELKQRLRPQPKVLFGVDARKLGSAPGGGGKEVRNGFPQQTIHGIGRTAQMRRHRNGSEQLEGTEENGGPWDIICFNFPHVGGLSTDVNRQVRANQELLVAFFKACIPLLSSSPPIREESLPSSDEEDCDSDGEDIEYTAENSKKSTGRNSIIRGRRTEPGQVLVTLFEGEPYSLWNIRDLARHVGLRVVTSFKFPQSKYPGYTHARTLGEIKGVHGRKGGWKGEERVARTYIFEKGQEMVLGLRRGQRMAEKKRRGDEGNNDDNSGDDNDG